MVRGRVTPRFEPLVPVDMVGAVGQRHTIEFIVDTGFDGDMSLPGELIRQLGFPLYEEYALTLANGKTIFLFGYEGQVMWHERNKRVLVLEADGDPLLGMRILWRNRITIDNYANGPVVVEELR